MSKSRFFRAVVCLLVICCILVTCIRPMTVDAFAIETSVAIGIVAAIVLLSAGVVFTVKTTQDVIALGNSMQSSLYSWADTEDKLDEADTLIGYCKSYFNNGSDHPKFEMSSAILAALALWVYSIIKGDEKVEVEGEAASEGYAYYNGFLAPQLSSDLLETCPYAFILKIGSGFQAFYGASSDFVVTGSSVYAKSNFEYHIYNTSSDGSQWSHVRTYYSSDVFSLKDGLIWSNFDIYNLSGNELFISASEPVYFGKEILVPNAFVGDIPEQVQSGEMEPEQIPLLSSLALGGVVGSLETAVEDLSAVSESLATGALTYDAFLNQITPETDPGGDPGGEDDTDPWDPPSDPGEFALDLKKFFPFCIPFDLYAFFTCLNADPVTPVIEWQVMLPGGSTYPLTIDLSPFDSLAQLLRRLELLAFCVGLAIKTRDLIRG